MIREDLKWLEKWNRDQLRERLRNPQQRYNAMERMRLGLKVQRMAYDLKMEAMLKDTIRPEMKEVKELPTNLLENKDDLL